jgi:hypothetical protein
MKGPAILGIGAVAASLAALAIYLGATNGDSSGTNGAPGSDDPGYVSRAEFGARWPLTVDAGILRCRVPGIVTFESNGVVYALSGNAEAVALGNDIGPIWADEANGRPKDLRPLIDRQQSL